MPRTVYIQSKSGDFDHEFPATMDASLTVAKIRKDGGYFLQQGNEMIFVPWHEIFLIRIQTQTA